MWTWRPSPRRPWLQRSSPIAPSGSGPSSRSSRPWGRRRSSRFRLPSRWRGARARAGDAGRGWIRRCRSRRQVLDRGPMGRPWSGCPPSLRRRRRCFPTPSRSGCVRALRGGGAGGHPFRWRFPRRRMTGSRLLRHRRKIRWFVVRRSSDVGRRWWSRHRLPRPDCPGSCGELPSLGARDRDMGERGSRTGSEVPTSGTVAVSVERTRPPSACAAAIQVARVIAHPIRPSPALAFPRSRLSGDPGPGGRRFARLLDDHSISLVRRMGSCARRAGLHEA